MVDINGIKVNLNLPLNTPTEICLFCQETPGPDADLEIVNGNETILELLALAHIEYQPLPEINDYMCGQCAFKLVTIVNILRKMRSNISRRKCYYNNRQKKDKTNKLLGKRLRSANASPVAVVQEQNGLIQNINNIGNKLEILNVRTITPTRNNDGTGGGQIPSSTGGTPPTAKAKYWIDCLNDLQNDIETTPTRLLDIMYERSESVLATESGGNINLINDFNTKNHLKSNNLMFKCQYCTKMYRRQHFLKRHERTHSKGKRSIITNNSSSLNKQPQHQAQFECYHCDQKFSRNAQLRSHEKQHRRTINCQYCKEEFHLQTDLEWHLAKCIGKFSASKNLLPTRYHTRSQSLRTAFSSDNDDTESIYWNRDDISNWIKENHIDHMYNNNNGDDDDDGKSFASSLATTFSRASSRTDFTAPPSEIDYCSENNCSSFDNISIKTGGSFAKRTKKRKSIKKMKFTCPETGCNFTETTLEKIMYHDMKKHSELLLFYCKKCKGRFIRKEYLHYHLINQSYGRFACYICGKQFSYNHELKEHFELHRFRCNICNTSFVKAEDLAEHKTSDIHLLRISTEKTIFLERINYITIKQQQQVNQQLQIYEPKIKIMRLIENERINHYATSSTMDWQKWRIGTTLHHKRNSYNCALSKEQLNCKKAEDLFEMEMLQNNDV